MNIFPKSVPFFELFIDLSQTISTASMHLSALKVGSTGNRKHIVAIQKCELKGDETTHRIKQEADRAFITPIDREDIHELAKNLNKVLDYIENVSTGLDMFDVKENGKAFHSYIELIESSTQTIVELMENLSHKGSRVHQLKVGIKLVHTYEKKGDELTRNALTQLFKQKNAMHIIKWKHIYDNLELVLDACEETSDTVDQIVIKNY